MLQWEETPAKKGVGVGMAFERKLKTVFYGNTFSTRTWVIQENEHGTGETAKSKSDVCLDLPG